MKTFLKIIVSAIFAFSLQANGQVINLNPDPNAEPWAVSAVDIKATTGICDNPPVFQPTPGSLNKPLPVAVHNENSI